MANVIQSVILPMFYHLFNKNTKKQVTFNTSAVKHIYEHKKYLSILKRVRIKKTANPDNWGSYLSVS